MGDPAWILWLGWSLVGLGGLVGVRWLVGRSGRHVRRCPRCDYDLSATAGLACPECGRTARSERALHRRRRKRQLAWIAAGLIVSGFVLASAGPVRRDGWAAAVPNFVIWPVMPLFDSKLDALMKAQPTSREPTRWERLVQARHCVVTFERACAVLERDSTVSMVDEGRAIDAVGTVMGFGPGERRPVASSLLELAAQHAGLARAFVLAGVKQLTPLETSDHVSVRILMNDGEPLTWLVGFHILQRSCTDAAFLNEVAAEGLDHPSNRVRIEAIWWLGRQGDHGASSRAKLEAMMTGDFDAGVRFEAGVALEKLKANR